MSTTETRPSRIRSPKTGVRVVWREPSNLHHSTTAPMSKLNPGMIQLVPELDSKYATAPMYFPEWKDPEDVLENGDSCFIAAQHMDDGDGIRQDYIWMPQRRKSSLPAGYYHLQTQEAYIEVYSRIKKLRPAFTKKSDEYERIHRLIENRLTYERPSDRYGMEQERKRPHITISKLFRPSPLGSIFD